MEEIFDTANHYFEKVEPEQFVINLAYQLYLDGVDVCVISAADKDTIPDKYEWLKKNLPFIDDEHIFFAPLGADKTQFIKGNAEISALIDDYNPNLKAWEEAGGHSIKCLNGINSSHSGFSEISFERLKEQQATIHEAESDPNVSEEAIERAKDALVAHAYNSTGLIAEAIEDMIGFDRNAIDKQADKNDIDDKE
jgi:5'(3')-deoxyribonucleotidase